MHEMKKRTFAVLVSIIGVGLAQAACSAPEPGILTERSPSPSGAGDGTSPLPSSTYGDAGSSSGGKWDSGTGSPSSASDSGAAADSGGATTFLGDPNPYASKPPAATARERHAATGQAPQPITSECLTCHGPNGVGVQFIAAGFIATQPQGKIGAADVEVRVWSKASQTGVTTHTDADGFFWIKPPADAVAAPFQAGVRSATTQKIMPIQAPGGACGGSSCHGGGQGAVHL
jgi:hypothetical protein